jgi:uncharacterized protein
MPASQVQMIQDSVHGMMEFRGMETLVVEVLHTREVQRLRRIRQLGLVHLVFPGGEHSRFVHSLGVAYVAALFGRRLRDSSRDSISPFLLPDDTAIRDFALSALFHDLGHGPLSHAWEREIVGEDYDLVGWKKELGLADDHLLNGRRVKWHVLVGQGFLACQDGELYTKLESFEAGTAERVRAFLLGRYHIPYLPRLLDSDVDVDRADFLRRDSQQCGVTYGGYDLPRLVSTCTVGETDEKQLVVGFEQPKSIRPVEQFLIARRAMYEAVYRHKTVRSAEGMIALFLRRLKAIVFMGQMSDFGDRLVQPLMKMVAGEAIGQRELLSVDDFALQVLIDAVAHADRVDKTLGDLANRILSRDLFKIVPRPSEKIADFLQSPEAYPRIDVILKDKGFADPEYYRIIDKVTFDMLAERKEEWGYFVDLDGRASEMRDHESIRPIRGQRHDYRRLFVPEEAVVAVANLIK